MSESPSIEELRTQRRRDYDPYRDLTISENLTELADRREKCPMSFSEKGGFWVLSTYDDISSVLRRNNRGFVSFPNMPDGTQAFGQKRMIPLEVDGDIHAQYRRILNPMFAPKRIDELSDQIRRAATDLIDKFIEQGSCEFVSAFAFPYPATTFMALMGWPISDGEMLSGWVDTFLHGVLGADQQETDAARGKAATDMHEYFAAMIADRRATPRDDITTHLVQSEIDGQTISDEDLQDLLLVMMLAGLDTVQSVLAQSMTYLGSHQGKWQEMFASEETLTAAIEELLRWCSPAVPTRNVAEDSAKVGDIELPKGERVHCPLGAANRDPKYFPHPDEVRFDREMKSHLTFGLGAHRCIGLHLARLELKIAFEELHRALPSFSVAQGRPAHEHLGLTWGIDEVGLTFTPGTRR
jgi:cytochrome P450